MLPRRPEKHQVLKTPPQKLILFYCLAAALPSMLIAAIFNIALLTDNAWTPGGDLAILGYIMQAEFLAAASGILMILPLLVQVRTRALRSVRLGVFLVLGWAMAWLAYSVDGMEGMLFYALLVFVTYGGGTLFVFDWLSGISRTFLSLLRWSMAIFMYVSLQLYFDLDSDISKWKDTPAVVPFGACFFYTLFALEIILYPPLTWYLERKLVSDRALSRNIEAINEAVAATPL